VAVDALATA